MYSILRSFVPLFLLALALAPVMTLAYTDRTSTIEPAIIEAQELEGVRTNYNNPRSNRATISTPDETNICDGVTCPDGSCAPTAQECRSSVEATPATPVSTTCPDDTSVRCPDGSCAAATDRCAVGSGEAVPYRADSTHCAVGDDCDDADPQVKPGEAVSMPDDSCGIDEDCDGMTDEEPYLENDDDGDGYGEPEDRAQNHNSSRSNRTDAIAAPDDAEDSDDDDDGLSTMRAESADDKATPLLFDRLRTSDGGIDGVPLVFDALESSVQGEVATDPETNEPTLTRVSVSAEDMRSWGANERTSFEQVVAEAEEGTPEYTSLKITEQVLGDERIESLEASETGAMARYRARIRLFGFIPIERTVEARTTKAGEVEVEYPWYRFLSSTPDTAPIRELLSNTQAFFR